MSNYSIKLDLLKVKNVSLVNLTGKTATKQCIVIPVEDAGLYVGEKGVYLNLTAIELKEPKHEQSHMIKPNIETEVFAAMSQEQKDGIPIIGNMKPLVRKVNPVQPTEEMHVDLLDENGLPF